MTIWRPNKPQVKTPDPALPQFARETFPDATQEQVRFLQDLLAAMKQSNSRIAALERSMVVVGSQPRMVRSGGDTLFAGAAINVSAVGTAKLAVNTDRNLLATHMVTSVVQDQVMCVPMGIVDARCLPLSGASDTLWLSSTPGYLTDEIPDGEDEIVQVVARKAGLPDNRAGTCPCMFSSDIAGVSASINDVDEAVKAALKSHVEDMGNPHEVTKGQVGLGNVDNTKDIDKPISTATQAALDGKASASVVSGHISNNSNPHNVTKTQVGLGNVDNTSDLLKPISNATQAALNEKEGVIAAGSTGQYWRGDKSWQTLNKAAVGLGNVDNTSDMNKPVSTAMATALAGKANVSHTHTFDQISNASGALQLVQNLPLDAPGFLAFDDVNTQAHKRTLQGTPGRIEIYNNYGAGDPVFDVGASVARRDVANTFTAVQTFNERPIVDDGHSLPEGGSPVLTIDDPLNATMLFGTVPVAQLPSQAARRDQANTFSQLLTAAGIALSGQQILNSGASSDNVYTVLATDTILSYNSNNAHRVVFNLPNVSLVPAGKVYIFHARPGAQTTASHVQPFAGQAIYPNATNAPLVLPTAWHTGAILWATPGGWHFWKLGNW